MYKEAGAPLYAIQTGGDEVPRGSWLGSPACQALVESGKVESLATCATTSPNALRKYSTTKASNTTDGWK